MRRTSLITAAVALATMVVIGCGGSDTEPAAAPQQAAPAAPAAPPAPAQSAADVFEVVNMDPGGSGKYEFDPAEMTFKVGQTVNFGLKAETEFHTFTVPDLEIDVALDAKKTVPFTFTFNTAGTFKLKCLSHPQMTGEIRVQ